MCEKLPTSRSVGEYLGEVGASYSARRVSIVGMTPYPEMRRAHCDLGSSIPSHWVECQLRHLAGFQSGEAIAAESIKEEGAYPVFGGNGIRGYTKFYTHSGSFPLIGRQGALCGNVNFANGDFWASEHAVVAQPRNGIEPKWLASVLLALELRKYSVAAAQPGLAVEAIKRLCVARPPVAEQRAIARFLDYETARIDALIAKQERLIELLQEKRQAVISHAVTKGLNPDAPMKDSGVEWLGKVPAHWEVKRLARLVPDSRQIMYGIVLPGPNVDDGVMIVKGGDVKPGRLSPEKLCKTTPEIESKFVRSRLRAGDLVYAIRGGIGDVEIVPAEIDGANITQDAARIAPLPEYESKWLLYVLKSRGVFAQLEQGATGATIRGINIFDLKRVKVPVPPPAERDQIKNHLDGLLAGIDKLLDLAGRSIKLSRERRTALISAAVTGKIDVRNWHPPEEQAA